MLSVSVTEGEKKLKAKQLLKQEAFLHLLTVNPLGQQWEYECQEVIHKHGNSVMSTRCYINIHTGAAAHWSVSLCSGRTTACPFLGNSVSALYLISI